MIKVLVLSALLGSAPLLLSAKSEGGKQEPFRFDEENRVLDGDTILFRGESLKIAGIDAPELGPWAKCWAEAALAGHAKDYVETTLSSGNWNITITSGAGPNEKRLAHIVRSDGEDLSDLMVVYGYAAAASVRWNWCGENAKLHSPDQDEPEPHGPNLWWPTGAIFDPRAAD